MPTSYKPVSRSIPAVTLVCAVLSLFLTAGEFGWQDGEKIFMRLSPDFFAGGFAPVLRLMLLAVPLSMLLLGLFMRRLDARLMLVPSVLGLVCAGDELLFMIRDGSFTGRDAVLWGVCRAGLPAAVLVVFALTLFGIIKRPFPSALVCAGAMLLSLGIRIVFFIIENKVNSAMLPEGTFYLGIASFVMSLDFPLPVLRKEGSAVPDCPDWEDGDIPEELCEHEDIAACVLISVITFGLYQLVWMRRVCRKIRLVCGEESACGKEFAMMVFVPFYILYWMKTRAKKLSDGAFALHIPVADNGLFYLLFSCCGLSLFGFAMLQKDLNMIAAKLEASASAASLSRALLKKEQSGKAEAAKPADDTTASPAKPDAEDSMEAAIAKPDAKDSMEAAIAKPETEAVSAQAEAEAVAASPESENSAEPADAVGDAERVTELLAELHAIAQRDQTQARRIHSELKKFS